MLISSKNPKSHQFFFYLSYTRLHVHWVHLVWLYWRFGTTTKATLLWCPTWMWPTTWFWGVSSPAVRTPVSTASLSSTTHCSCPNNSPIRSPSKSPGEGQGNLSQTIVIHTAVNKLKVGVSLVCNLQCIDRLSNTQFCD